MKRFLEPKLIFTLVTVVMLASAIALPLLSGAIRYSHASSYSAPSVPATDIQPAWWNSTSGPNMPCDFTNYKNYTGVTPVLLTSWNGIEVCGPAPTTDHPVQFIPNPNGTTELEFECPELVKRYLLLLHGLPSVVADGYQVVDAYTSRYPTVLKKITPNIHIFPSVGDVLSYGRAHPGHTSIVTAVANTNPTNGSADVTVVEQNIQGLANGTETMHMSGWNMSGIAGRVFSWMTFKTWNIVSSPNPGTNNYLQAVTSTSSSDVWAVGYSAANSVISPTALHWNGSSWGRNAISGYSGDYLLGVSAISSSDVLAVGVNLSGTVAMHYNGTSWSSIPADSPGGSSAQLNAVASNSSGDAWAVGTIYSSDTHIIIEKYAGSSTGFQNWTLTGGRDTTGTAIIGNLSGTTNNELNGVAVYSSTDVWAVGDYKDSSNNVYPLTYHWDGSSWTNVSVPAPDGSSPYTKLYGVTEISANNVWAVGSTDTTSGHRLTYTIHWDGSSWTQISSPSPSQNSQPIDTLYAVASTSGNQGGYVVYAVGFTRSSSDMNQTLILRYNSSTNCGTPFCNSQWVQESSPNAGSSANNSLYGVTVTSSGAWAVGYYGSSPYTLTEHLV